MWDVLIISAAKLLGSAVFGVIKMSDNLDQKVCDVWQNLIRSVENLVMLAVEHWCWLLKKHQSRCCEMITIRQACKNSKKAIFKTDPTTVLYCEYLIWIVFVRTANKECMYIGWIFLKAECKGIHTHFIVSDVREGC